MRRERIHRKPNHFFGGVLVLALFGASLAAGYGLATMVFRVTGRPGDFWAYLVTGYLGFLAMYVLFGVLTLFRGHNRNDRRSFQRTLTDALAQISQGNFDVWLDSNDRFVDEELAAAINDMAKKLGTLETMRQDFISNVSHEIQSPLTSITGFATLLRQEDLPHEQRQRYVEIIEAESRRLSSLSENLLKLSSLDNNKIPLSKAEIRLDKQLEAVALTLEPQWTAKDILLEAELKPCTLCGDGDLLQQVWMNLINNAIKFTPKGGRILISLSCEADRAVVKVSDTGIGISAEDQIHLFERFYKASKARERDQGGNGLGLSLVKMIVELHEGQVQVESRLEEGTSFTVFLPGLHRV